jgi:HSP20 family protein
MSLLFPVYRQARCGPAARPVRNDLAPLFSLFDEALPTRHYQRRAFAPRFNVNEAHDFYQLEGELPGLEQEDISVEFTGENTLTVSGRVGSKKPAAAPAAETASTEAAPAEDAASETSSKKATVEDDHEGEWTDVATPATEAGPSTAAPKAPETPAQSEAKQPESKTWVSERFAGEFSRSFSFADRVDQEAVTARLNNGILTVIVPKAAKPENRKISIA